MTAQPATLLDDVFTPGQRHYEAAARLFFTTAAPSLVIQPGDAAAVAGALRDPAFSDISVAIRSGGHDPRQHRNDRRSMIIDLKRLDDVEVLDPSRRLVRIGGGSTWGRVAAVLDRYGWGLTAGDTADVGVGGLTLGGGFGWMVRRYGLAIDNLVGARVVTADGRILRTSADDHADLFWAIRGGGGNFGVVVDFDFIAQPVAVVHFGSVTYHGANPGVVVARWRDVMRHAPEELSSTLMLPPGTAGGPTPVTVAFCYAHDRHIASDADGAIRPLLELGSVSSKSVRHCRYAETLEPAGHPPPVRMLPQNTLVDELDRAVIEKVCALHGSPTPTAIAVRSLGGAFSRVPPEATAFAHRSAEAMIVALLMSTDPAPDLGLAPTLERWEQLAALGSGSYVNFNGSSTAADLTSAYPAETYRRLAEVKQRYDPDNRFVHNHNITPASTAT